MKPILAVCALAVSFALAATIAYAGPSNGTFELEEYGFTNGGTDGSGAGNGTYSVFGAVGEVSGNGSGNGTVNLGEGLIFTMQANVPPAPSFTNPSTLYDRLLLVVSTGGNASDTEFAIAISDDSFVTTRYVQSDGTVGTTLGSEDWQTYTAWGGGSGTYVTRLVAGTTYQVKVKARQGNFTESDYGPVASASTQQPTMTFGIDAASLTFSNLNAGNSFTDSSKSTVLTTSTNAYNGYIVYGRETGPLSFNTFTIPDYGAPNSAPTAWTGTGFGYSTSDSSLTGGTADRFTSGGPNYAGFTTAIPGDPVADNPGPLLSPVTGEQFTVSYRVTASSSQQAGQYRTNVIYVIVPTY